MNYKLKKSDNDEVKVVMLAGSDYVVSSMPEGRAIGIIESAEKIEKSDKFDGFGISVDEGKYYFAGTVKADEEKSADEPKKNDQNFKNKWKK